MPTDYNMLQRFGEQPSLAQDLSQQYGGYLERKNQAEDRQNRLSQLARQDEIQGYQMRGLQRAEEAIPAQQAEAQRQAAAKHKQELNLGLAQRLRETGDPNAAMEWGMQESQARGIDPALTQKHLSQAFGSGKPIEELANQFEMAAYPEQAAEARFKSMYAKPKESTPSALATMIAEKEAATGRKLSSQETGDLYSKAIELKTTKPDQTLVQVQLPTGETVYQSRSSAAGMSVPKKAGAAALSTAAQKELFEADDVVQSAKNVQDILKSALKINEKTYSGYGAKERAVARSNLPGESVEADNTITLDNMMTGQALQSLKIIFGGMPTEGERKILLDMQASADKTPTQRKGIMERAMEAAKKREQFASQRAKSLRAGTYFSEQPANVDSLLDKYKD